jgi:hypothetical protein
MNELGDLKNRLEITAKILLRCFILNFALILFWFFFFLIGNGQWGYEVHSRIFDITRHDFVLINYCGMAFVKLCNIIFFLFPYVAIRLVLNYKFRQ